MCLLGGVLLVHRQYSEAEPLLLAGHEGLQARVKNVPSWKRITLAEAAGWLVQFYTARGQQEKAAEWKARLFRMDLPVDVFAWP
jgi:hypothetical protein